ncbi:fimbrillin family protein, partial [Hoylesella saccharolytica]|uniref:fimbrillin family protein n=1 Tax=Hoylesella saccharolytica TaxID=633701 RepID=UPI0028D747B4
SDKDIDSNENNGKALVAFNVSEKQDQAQAAAKANQSMTRAAFANQLALQDLAPEDLTMQKLPVQGTASQGLCLIETTVAGVPSQREDETPTRANITTMTTMQNFSTTAFYGPSDTSLEPWFYDKDTKKDGNLVTPIYWDWFKNHGCFYAVYPKPYSKLQLSPSTYTGTPYVDFEVEPNVTNQKDLMTACSGNVHTNIGTMSATAPRTDLTFRHALTAVRFKVGQNLSWNKTITKVEIIGAKSKGKYTLPTDKTVTGAWNPASLSTPATFTLGGDGTVSVSTSAAVNNVIMGNSGDNFVFYMIPQSLAGVSVKIYFADATPPIGVNLTGTWKPGTTKTYALSQNTSSWQYELTVTPPAAAEYNAVTTGNYTIQSYRKDGTIQKPVPWKVVGYSTDGGLTWSNNKPVWFTGLTKENGDGSTSGETGVGNLVPDVGNQLIVMNANLKLNPKGSATNYYDLSTHDIKGNVTPRTTANCYVISHPGYYKIPLVYGNAITNGNTNTNAYTYTGSPTDPNIAFVLEHFKDHNNQDITDPWITQSNGGVNAPDGAKLVWADESGLVTNLAVTGSGSNAFVQFEVPAANIKNGNAVIAVTKGGTVVWSWHLWFIHDNALNTITCTNIQGCDYKFTEEALGMKYTTWTGTGYTSPRSVKIKVVQSYGQGSPMVPKEGIITITQNPGNTRQGIVTLYQFGRKDAFPGTDSNLEGTFNKNAGSDMSIPNSIQHPENFYTDGLSWYKAPPTGYTWYNLWSANNTTTGFNDNIVIKTVYDPCPAGFKMPASNAFTSFSKVGNNTATLGDINVSSAWSNGWNFNNKITAPDASVYFPASGFRTNGFGSLSDVGNLGYYWSALGGTSNGCGLSFAQWYVSPLYNDGRAMGFSVRPVAEIRPKVTPKTPGSSVEAWQEEELDGGHGRQQ